MGYDLHITRRRRWAGPGPAISSEEWLEYVDCDQELRLAPDSGPFLAEWRPEGLADEEWRSWLEWDEGGIHTKNPDDRLIDKMVSIARALGAMVQGDDGEVYEAADQPPREIPPSLAERATSWMERLRSHLGRHRRAGAAETILPFDVGDRVFDPAAGIEYTVIEIAREADHGLGWIRIRDDDGVERRHTVIAHGLRPAGQESE